jgi:hypothetical protein
MIQILAGVLFLAAQENATVARSEKGDYPTAISKCKEAEGMIESDPQGAIDRLSEIIGNPKVAAKIERRIRVEERPAEYTPYYAFTPYLYRGQARLALARKVEKTDAELAQKLLVQAVEDLKESGTRRVEKANEIGRVAMAELDRLKKAAFVPPSTPAAVDPLVKFRESWDPLLLDEKFKSALKLIEADKTLTADQKKGFQATTEQKCREVLVKQVSALRPRFVSALSQGLDRLTGEEFDVAFALAPSDEMIAVHPVLDWMRQSVPALRDVQSGKTPPQALFGVAAAAAGLESTGANPWFQSIEAVAFAGLKTAASAEADRARDLPKAEREKARAQVVALTGQYKDFLKKLDAKAQERYRFLADHDAQLARIGEGFPVELAELDKVDGQIDAAFGAASPEAEFDRVDQSLEALESRPNASRESRQRLWTARAVVAALKGLAAGRAEDAVAGELSGLRSKLAAVGGAPEVKQYGPRVEKVLSALR